MKSAAAILIAVMIWGVGLMAFVSRVDHSTPAPEPERAEGIVALTGASVIRLEEATRLLEEGKGKRLLVSGVNRKASREDILGVTKAVKPIYDCCVDLGFMAADTVGNAKETAEWARGKGYDRLILVTADFHMPRAMLELRAAMPEAQVTPYPVVTEPLDTPNWWRTSRGARLMVVEYCKYLAILGREGFLSLGPKTGEPGGKTPA